MVTILVVHHDFHTNHLFTWSNIVGSEVTGMYIVCSDIDLCCRNCIDLKKSTVDESVCKAEKD